MYHLLLTFCLVAIVFAALTRRNPIETAYWLLAGFPMLMFIVGMFDEYCRGIQQFNHQVLHLSYDGSYLLLLVGIILVVRAVRKRKVRIGIVAGTCFAGIPLAYIFITQ